MTLSMKRIYSTYLTGLTFCFSFLVWFAAVVTAFALMLSMVGCASETPELVKASIVKTPGLYLVSVGNGDQDNITLRALNTMKAADIVFCRKDAVKDFPHLLKGKQIEETSLNIHRTFMRKKTADYPKALQEVKRVSGIVRSAIAEGKTVVVLDSGDPTIYGPNMWFMEAFEDLNPEIVPGVSCFNCANAALRKGVAAGEKTRSVILSNGMDIEKLAEAKTSMVFFTMHLSLQDIVAKLKPHYGGDTPIAIVGNAGYSKKECIYRGTLDTILEQTKGKKLPIHLVYVGDFLTKRYGIKETEKELAGKADAKTSKQVAKENSKPLVLSEWNMPMPTILGDPQLHAKLESIFVTTKNAFGMIRKVNLIQCNQFHNRPSQARLLANARKKREDGKNKTRWKKEGRGMCLGMASGFLASHYAIKAMYGDEIPDIEDFTLGSNCPMVGLWDSLNLVCAKNLTRGDPDSAPTRGSFSFTITRASDGRSITFTFAKAYQEKFGRFFDMKWHPEKHKDAKGEIRQLKGEMIKSLLTRFANGDYGYFEVVKSNG